jgi:hypothetical protein
VSIHVVQYLNGRPEDGIEAVEWDFGYGYYGGGVHFTPGSLYLLALSSNRDGTHSVVGFLSKRLDGLRPSDQLRLQLVPTEELQRELDRKAKQGAKAPEADIIP